MAKYVVQELTNSLSQEESKNRVHDNLSAKITFLSVLTIGVMIFIGFIQTILVQKFVINKKAI